jgi:hypothetical protein
LVLPPKNGKRSISGNVVNESVNLEFGILNAAPRPNALMKISHFEDLDIWQDARSLCKLVFQLTSKDPFCKDYRFRDQIRAASGSVMDNPVK